MLFQIALFWNDVILILVCLYKFYLPYLRWKHNYVKTEEQKTGVTGKVFYVEPSLRANPLLGSQRQIKLDT
jgi:hypothetical protein